MLSPIPDLTRELQLLEELGNGASGKVWKAENSHGELFAFKEPKPGFYRYIQREVHKAIHLVHPHIARVWGMGEAISRDGRIHQGIVTEFVDGDRLSEFSDREQLPKLLYIAAGVAAALDYAHKPETNRDGILHRDLKPENIMIRRSDHCPKIVDFGSAFVVKDPDELNQTVAAWEGSKEYVPPELARAPVRFDPDGRGDMYSFAATLYVCLTSHPPLPFPSDERLLPEPPGTWTKTTCEASLLPDIKIPRHVWEVLRRGLARDYRDRPLSAQAFVNDLRVAWENASRVRGRMGTTPRSSELGTHETSVGWQRIVIHHIDESEMILIEPRRFTMGHDEYDCDPTNEPHKPAHEVELSQPFYMDKYPVTNLQFARYVKQSGATSGKWATHYQPGRNDHFPVRDVTWEDAKSYCQWAGKRLPTEAQWEGAAKGTENYLYPTGNTFEPGTIRCEESESFYVGAYPPGPYGLCDMCGLIEEWVFDWCLDDMYARRKKDGITIDPCAEQSGGERCIRGGHWASTHKEVMAIMRQKLAPSRSRPSLGFRTTWSPAWTDEGI